MSSSQLTMSEQKTKISAAYNDWIMPDSIYSVVYIQMSGQDQGKPSYYKDISGKSIGRFYYTKEK